MFQVKSLHVLEMESQVQWLFHCAKKLQKFCCIGKGKVSFLEFDILRLLINCAYSLRLMFCSDITEAVDLLGVNAKKGYSLRARLQGAGKFIFVN